MQSVYFEIRACRGVAASRGGVRKIAVSKRAYRRLSKVPVCLLRTAAMPLCSAATCSEGMHGCQLFEVPQNTAMSHALGLPIGPSRMSQARAHLEAGACSLRQELAD